MAEEQPEMPWDEHGVSEVEESGGGSTFVKSPLDEPGPSAPLAQFECGRCEKRFESAVALRMHKMRVHTPAGRQGAKKGGQKAAKNRWQMNIPKGSTREKELERRRIYQKKLRERYYAEGRDSKGNLKPPGWKPRPRGRGIIKPIKVSYINTLTGKEREDYAARQRQYQRNHYAKKQAEKKAADSEPSTGTISTDITGEAARAILLAAKVIRGVAQSLKLP